MGTGASGDGGPRLTLFGSFQKRKIKTIKSRRLTGGCAAGTVDARNQGKAIMADLAPPLPLRVQGPANGKRGRDLNDEIIWASKKQRSSMAVACERGKAITGRIRAAAAATSSLIVQESAGNSDGGDVGVVLDEKKKVKLRPCVFVAPVRVLDGLARDCEVTQFTVLDMEFPSRHVKKPVTHDFHNNDKRSHPATVADCEGGNGAETTSRRSPVQEAKAAGCHGHKIKSHSAPKTNNGSARKTPMRPFMSLSSGLQCLGVTDARPVIEKTLTATDSNPDQSRLQFSPREVMESPLISILTEEEWKTVRNAGLHLEAIDRHSYLYNMRFKRTEAAEGLLMLSDCNNGSKV
ncbi:hypothetical protein BS78_09G110800 [Paspalum vaginatum]|nr:hypothetical protein BS78_09G110800 [Paspalum vaginatum]